MEVRLQERRREIINSFEPRTFDVALRRKCINIFEVGKLRVFKHFFDDNK